MNIQDAIKSDKPFRRSLTHIGWYEWKDFMSFPSRLGNASEPYHFEGRDLIADDWEIQEPTVTITKSQLRAALLAPAASAQTVDDCVDQCWQALSET